MVPGEPVYYIMEQTGELIAAEFVRSIILIDGSYSVVIPRAISTDGKPWRPIAEVLQRPILKSTSELEREPHDDI